MKNQSGKKSTTCHACEGRHPESLSINLGLDDSFTVDSCFRRNDKERRISVKGDNPYASSFYNLDLQ